MYEVPLGDMMTSFVNQVIDEMKRLPWIASSVLMFWFGSWAIFAYAVYEVHPVVETYGDTRDQVSRIEVSLLEDRLFERHKDFCLMDQPVARQYLQEQIQQLSSDYYRLTGNNYIRPPCDSFR